MLNELRAGRKTAKDIANVLDIQVSAARKHLEALSSLNIVREEFVQEGIGRPKKFYCLTEKGFELFPRQYEKILCAILDELKISGGQIGESLMKQLAHDISTQINLGVNNGSLVETLSNGLNAFGFDVTVEDTSGGIVITSHNCPLYKAAMKHQKLMCHGLHDEIIKSSLGTRDVKLERCLTRGDSTCRHVIDKKNLRLL